MWPAGGAAGPMAAWQGDSESPGRTPATLVTGPYADGLRPQTDTLSFCGPLRAHLNRRAGRLVARPYAGPTRHDHRIHHARPGGTLGPLVVLHAREQAGRSGDGKVVLHGLHESDAALRQHQGLCRRGAGHVRPFSSDRRHTRTFVHVRAPTIRMRPDLATGKTAAAIGERTDARTVMWVPTSIMMSRVATPPLFDDRDDAGRRLATELVGLSDRKGAPVVVIGLARGGVPVAAEVARRLGARLGVLAVKKVGHPLQPEFALGAVTPGGALYLRERGGLSPEEIDRVVSRAVDEVGRKAARFSAVSPPPHPSGAVCVLVDDGLATGATLVAAARWARAEGAARVLAAVPVASTEGAALLADEVDAVVCPYVTDAFGAVSVWYRHFDQVDDSTVEKILRTFAAETKT